MIDEGEIISVSKKEDDVFSGLVWSLFWLRNALAEAQKIPAEADQNKYEAQINDCDALAIQIEDELTAVLGKVADLTDATFMEVQISRICALSLPEITERILRLNEALTLAKKNLAVIDHNYNLSKNENVLASLAASADFEQTAKKDFNAFALATSFTLCCWAVFNNFINVPKDNSPAHHKASRYASNLIEELRSSEFFRYALQPEVISPVNDSAALSAAESLGEFRLSINGLLKWKNVIDAQLSSYAKEAQKAIEESGFLHPESLRALEQAQSFATSVGKNLGIGAEAALAA